MRPIIFEGANFTFTAPPGLENCDDLPVHKSSDNCMHTSCWELSDAELVEVYATKRVFVTVMGHELRHPPIMVTAMDPQS